MPGLTLAQQLDERVADEAARRVLQMLLDLFVRQRVASDIAVLAMADACALQAVQHDLDTGAPRSLHDRLDVFCARVEATYRRAYPAMAAARARTAG